MRTLLATLGLALALFFAPGAGSAQVPAAAVPGGTAEPQSADLFAALRWRNIGPNRGGRSITAAGSADRPLEYWFGATGGGLWKTTDGGTTWSPATDGQIASSSVGAVAVAPSDPDVVYVGMGEAQLRGNVMQGDGVYRSADGGVTWTHVGLDATQAIARIRVHPRDPDVAWVAALGHPFGPNPERGVFRTRDGGRSWERVLFRDERTGAVDLSLDPANPDVIYATLWEVYRRPWKLWSGGPGSGLFKSTDGGDTWTELTSNPGLPRGVLGKITVAVGADSRTVYANVEAEAGGIYRSDDGGATWTYVNGDRDLWQRSFYFLRITADPVSPRTLWVQSFQLEKSTDGGETFQVVPSPHSDHHDLWIDPRNPERMINANDGGANVSTNGGRTWTRQSYPTAQIYRVATTADFPYHVCGAQQDNTTVCVPSDGGARAMPGIGRPGDWFYAVGGGESAYIAPDPRDPELFYSGATNTLDRFDRRTGEARDVQPNPYTVMGEAAEVMPERWNWVYPIVLSPADHALYAGSQHLWRSRDEGRSWERISPDLTRADPATLGETGGPVLLDQDGPEVYATIYTIAPSPLDARTIWTGSDDGLVHVTRDGGATWADVTPPDMPANTRIGLVDASPHDALTAWVAGRRYEMDDRAPYAWKTTDGGAHWTRIVSGLPDGAFVHAVREDPVRRGLLWAGTEHGVWVSLDAGARWRPISLNLPDLAATSVAVTRRDVVIASHGRSFWVLDDVAPVRQWADAAAATAVTLATPVPAVRRVYPAHVDFVLAAAARAATVEILDAAGAKVRTLVDGKPLGAGAHRVSWDVRYPGATVFENMILEGGDPSRGPWAPPGRYQARVAADGVTRSVAFEVVRDPRLDDVTDADLAEQFALAMRIRDATSAANEGVLRVRALRRDLEARLERAADATHRAAADSVLSGLASVEGELYQVRNRSAKDKIAYPIKLNDRLTGLRTLLEGGDERPTAAQLRVFEELSRQLEVQLQRLRRIESEEIPRILRLIADG